LAHQKNAMVVMGEVTGVDTSSKVVNMADGHHFDYDYLVLAIGATHSYFTHPEWAAIAPGLKSVEDATEFACGYCSALSGPSALTSRRSDPAIRPSS
jgi:NADH dehydrogenase